METIIPLIEKLSCNQDYTEVLIEYNLDRINYFKKEKNLFNNKPGFIVGYKHIYNSINDTNLAVSDIGAFVFTKDKTPSINDFCYSYLSHKILFEFLKKNNVNITLRDLGFKYFNESLIILVQKENSTCVEINDNVLSVKINSQDFDVWKDIRILLKDNIKNFNIQECQDDVYLEKYRKAKELCDQVELKITDIESEKGQFDNTLKLLQKIKSAIGNKINEDKIKQDFGTVDKFYIDISLLFISNLFNLFDWESYCLFPSSIHSINNNNNYSLFFSEKPDLEEIEKIHALLNFEMAEISVGFFKYLLKVSQIKSSIAAIMGRNGSHNLGSHVISNVIHHYCNPMDMQYLYKYMQHRMDFIASITSDWPRWTSSLPLCKFIMRYLFQQRLILNHIVRAEGLSAFEPNNGDLKDSNDNKLIIKVGKREIKDPSKIAWIIDPQETNYLDHQLDHQKLSSKDVNLAIPGGIVGLHAFYSIIENTLRNIAKHDWANRDNSSIKNLEYYIIYQENKKDVTITISGNVCKINNEKDSENGFIPSMNQKLYSPIVDPLTSSHRTKDLGLAEVKICAEFLNRAAPANVDNEQNELLSKIQIKPLDFQIEKGNSLWGYELKIPKPKSVLFIGNEFPKEYHGSQVEIFINETDVPDFDYDFVVYASKCETQLRDPRMDQPLRVMNFSLNDTNIISGILKNGGTETEKEQAIHVFVFNRYLQKLYNDENLTIDLEITLRDPKHTGQDAILNQFDSFFNSEVNRINRNTPQQDENIYFSRDDKFKEKLGNIYNKYEEHIETLPNIFIDGKKNGGVKENPTGKQQIKKKLIFGQALAGTPKKIVYKRHANDPLGISDYYIESISGSQSYFYELENLFNSLNKLNLKSFELNSFKDYSQKIFLYELIENARYHYHIFDERMFEFYMTLILKDKEGTKDFKLLNKFLNVGITVCQHLLVSGKKGKDDPCNCDSKIAHKYCAQSNLKDDYLKIAIIHIGLLDKLPAKGELLKILSSKYEFIILTSGRAPSKEYLKKEYLGEEIEADNLWRKVRFLAISELHNALKKQFPEKLLFTNLVMKSQIIK